MPRAKALLAVALLLAVSLTGCRTVYTPTAGEEVEVSGRVVGPNSQPLRDVRIAFVATGGAAVSNAFPLRPDGTYSGKLIRGTYTYFLSPLSEDDKRGEAVLRGLPESYTKASLDRQINVTGGALDLKF